MCDKVLIDLQKLKLLEMVQQCLREWFSQSDERHTAPRIPVMINMTSASVSSQKNQENQEPAGKGFPSLDELHSASRNSMMLDEFSDEDEEFQVAEVEQEAYNEVEQTALEEDPTDQIDLSCFSGNLRRNDNDDGRDCWTISDGNNFRVRSKHFFSDKSKIPAGKHTMELVAVDWLKDIKRIDHVARRPGCAVQLMFLANWCLGQRIGVASEKGLFSLAINLQVPGSTHYSMVFYLVTKQLVPGSLLQCFVDGDDEFRNSRLKLIPSVPKVPFHVAILLTLANN
ncbi:Protein enhanced disease resistance 2 [Vitis vinifera]|uniref:Protein enhanced disease resistance 2 n=1 Tax=Vitis vinifera TaxID=29760 RepID=A0A438H4L6_VITVI|nr:Protein enhanced disease resistance 2 [Vitis vinifera]